VFSEYIHAQTFKIHFFLLSKITQIIFLEFSYLNCVAEAVGELSSLLDFDSEKQMLERYNSSQFLDKSLTHLKVKVLTHLSIHIFALKKKCSVFDSKGV
jgi:hypothetical protein